jgi:hypothetical protein
MVLNVSTGQSEKYYIPLDQRIYVLEDIDAKSDLVMDRSVKKAVDKCPDVPASVKTNPNKPDTYSNDESWTQAEKIDLSFLLNLLDGVLEIPGRIVIMTSNFPEKLDHALIRPGRIDVIANFTKCSHSTMIEMMEFFYDIVLTDEEKEAILRTKEYVISPAEMSKIMFENFGNHAGAIQKLGKPVVPSIQSIEVETTDEAIFQPSVDDKEIIFSNNNFTDISQSRDREIEKKIVEASPEVASPELIKRLSDIDSHLDALRKSNFPDDNYDDDRTDRMDDRKEKLSECATFIDRMNANWLTAVGNEVTGKIFTPHPSTNVVVPYGSESQTNQFSSFE